MLVPLSALTVAGLVAAELGDPQPLRPLPRRSNVPRLDIGVGGIDLALHKREVEPTVVKRGLNGSVIALGAVHK